MHTKKDRDVRPWTKKTWLTKVSLGGQVREVILAELQSQEN